MKISVDIFYKTLIFTCVFALAACANPNPTKISDRDLVKQIRLTLYKNGLYQHNDIKIEIFEGRIILKGKVQSASQANDVNTIANSFVDPDKIDDHLKIKYKNS